MKLDHNKLKNHKTMLRRQIFIELQYVDFTQLLIFHALHNYSIGNLNTNAEKLSALHGRQGVALPTKLLL